MAIGKLNQLLGGLLEIVPISKMDWQELAASHKSSKGKMDQCK
jgi:hypothetical protein